MQGYKIIRVDRTDHYGGILMWIHNSIQISDFRTSRPEDKNQYILVNTFTITIIGMYIPPNQLRTTEDIKNILTKAKHQRKIIAGDFNTPPPQNVTFSNINYQYPIITLLEEINMFCINDKRYIHIGNWYQRNTIPDLTFLSENLMLDYAWEIIQDTLGSDHIPIILMIQNSNLQ